MKKRKTDRRTLYTINVIKDTFLALLETTPFSKITVTKLCQESDITRSTFYLHFDSLGDLLNQVIDEAMQITPLDVAGLDDLSQNTHSLLPICQRIGDNPKYRALMMEPDLSEYIIARIIQKEGPRMIQAIQEKTGLSSSEAKTLFIYILHGSFAVSRLHQFQKTKSWEKDLELLNLFVDAGYRHLNDDH